MEDRALDDGPLADLVTRHRRGLSPALVAPLIRRFRAGARCSDALQLHCKPGLDLPLGEILNPQPSTLKPEPNPKLQTLKQVRNHRVHHKHSEEDGDPHNATRGFFFAHVGWLYLRKHPAVVAAGKKLALEDLKADGFMMSRKCCDPWFAMGMCVLMPAAVAKLGWGEGFWPALWVSGALRYVVCLHFTWLVNSAAHFFGAHPYDARSSAAENPLVSLATIGEGWHKWHHKSERAKTKALSGMPAGGAVTTILCSARDLTRS